MRSALSVILALMLVGVLVELSCLAGERVHVQPSAAPAGLLRPAPTVDPSSLSENDADEVGEVAASPALTR